MPSYCSVVGCSNHFQPHLANYEPVTESKIKFYSFPSRPYLSEIRKKWILFTKRQRKDGSTWKPGKHSKICSSHFIGNCKSTDPRSPSYYPTIHPLSTKAVNSDLKMKRYERLRNRENRNNPLASNTNEDYSSNITVANDQLQNIEHNRVSENNPVRFEETVNESPTINPPNQQPHHRCYVCQEIQLTWITNNTTSVTKIPDKVMHYLNMSRRLTPDTIESLKTPMLNYRYCEKCTQMSDSVLKFANQLDEIKLKLNTALQLYVARIINCRESREGSSRGNNVAESACPIMIAKNIFSENEPDELPQSGDNNSSGTSNTNACSSNGLKVNRINTTQSSSTNSSSINANAMEDKNPKFYPVILKRRKIQPVVAKMQKVGDKFPDADFEKHRVFRFKCKYCPKVFWSEVGLSLHVKRHLKNTELHTPSKTNPRNNCKSNIEKKSITEATTKPKSDCESQQVTSVSNVVKTETAETNSHCGNEDAHTTPKTPREDSEANEKSCNFKCYKCSKLYSSVQSLNSHQRKHYNCDFVKCKYCKLKVSRALLDIHMEHYHASYKSDEQDDEMIDSDQETLTSSDDETPPVSTAVSSKPLQKSSLKCTVCKSVLQRLGMDTVPKDLMKNPIARCSSLYCPLCKKAFVLAPNSFPISRISHIKPKEATAINNDAKVMENKMKTTTGPEQNLHKCVDCTKAFSSRYNLLFHRNVQCLKLMRHCDFCKEYFETLCKLRSHVGVKHVKDPKIYWKICSMCDDSYFNRTHHQSSCSGKKEKQCDKCEIVCPSEKLLIMHLQAKHEETPAKFYEYVRQNIEKGSFKRSCETKKEKKKIEKALCRHCGKIFGNIKSHYRNCQFVTTEKVQEKETVEKQGK